MMKEVCRPTDVFKEVFKQLKRKKPPPNFSDVLDYRNVNINSVGDINLYYQPNPNVRPKKEPNNEEACSFVGGDECPQCSANGLIAHDRWELYGCKSSPGFVLVKNPFTPSGQALWIRKCLETYPFPPNETNLEAREMLRDVRRLRWVTMGYHHDWKSKVYSRERWSPLPSCLKSLSQHVTTVLGVTRLDPQASIINYYHLSSTLSGHTDHSELDLTLPLVSFSFGRSAIFMLGGRSKSVYPACLFVRSGDIMVMSGESRHAYHAVPRILPVDPGEELPWSSMPLDIEEYLKEFRININVRQIATDW